MSPLVSFLLAGSLILLGAGVVYRWIVAGNPIQRLLHLGAIIILALIFQWLLGFHFRSEVVSKGPADDEPLLVCLLYLSMLAGMVANTGYDYLTHNQNSRLELRSFLIPLLTSPIVFLPLASTLEAASASQRVSGGSGSKLMLLLVAFQNGFFWQDFFVHRKSSKRRSRK